MRTFSEEHRRKLSEASRRRGPRGKHTEETKAKMSESRRRGLAEGRIIPKGSCSFRDPDVLAKAMAARKQPELMPLSCRGKIFHGYKEVAEYNNVPVGAVGFQLHQNGDLDMVGAKNNKDFYMEVKCFIEAGNDFDTTRIKRLRHRHK